MFRSLFVISPFLLIGCNGELTNENDRVVDASSRDSSTAMDDDGGGFPRDSSTLIDAGITTRDGGTSTSDSGVDDSGRDSGSTTSSAMVDVINEYRVSQGLSRIPFSPSLTRVAELHVVDLAANYRSYPPECNLHSWGDDSRWTDCCYTRDHC